MTFLGPFALWFLAGLPVIALLYLRRIERRPATVSTLLFWQRVMEQRRPRALFQRLRQLLSLLLHLAIFLLLFAALAKPILSRFATAGTSSVLVIDTRARMQAREPDGRTRFEKAVQLAIAYAASTGGNRELALLAAGSTPQVVVPFTSDGGSLTQALQNLHANDAPGSLESTVALATQLLKARSTPGEIIVLTDAPASLANPPANVRMIGVGTARENVGLVHFAARPLLASPQTFAVYLDLANFGEKPARGNVEITLDGKLLDVKPYQLAPGQHWRPSFTATSSTALNARGWLMARLDQSDALPLDNVAYAALPSFAPKHVLLVTKGNLFLEKALESNQLVRTELLAPEAFRGELTTSFDAVIFDQFVPLDFRLGSSLGNFLFVGTSPFGTTQTVENPLVSDTDSTHPLLRLVDFNAVTFLRANHVKTPADADGWRFDAPLRSFEQPLIIAGERLQNGQPQRLAVFAFDVAQTDLPLRVAFPLLMNNTVQWLSSNEADSSPALTTGQTWALENGAQIWDAPQQTITALPATFSPLVEQIFQPQRAGFYLEQAAPKQHWLAANPFSETESNLRIASAPATSALASLLGEAWWRWPLWIYCALAAFALFTAEWWLYHRRQTE